MCRTRRAVAGGKRGKIAETTGKPTAEWPVISSPVPRPPLSCPSPLPQGLVHSTRTPFPMGVLRFKSWFEATFPYAVALAVGPQEFDHVLIDMNSVIHESCERAGAEESVIAGVMDRLERLLQVCCAVRVGRGQAPGPMNAVHTSWTTAILLILVVL